MAGLTERNPVGALMEQEFSYLAARHKHYSKRSFADLIGLSASMLCHVLKGRGALSVESAMHIADVLGWSPTKKYSFLDLVKKSRNSNASKKSSRNADSQIVPQNIALAETTLHADLFASISDWYHGAILELIKVPNACGDVTGIAEMLNIPKATVRDSLQRLERLGLVQKNCDVWRAAPHDNIQVPSVPSEAIRNFHKGMLNKAWESLDKDSFNNRICTGVIIAKSHKRMEEVKKRIEAFRIEMMDLLQEGERTQLFHLALQFFPVSSPV